MNINPYLKTILAAIISTVLTIVQSSQNLSDWKIWVIPVATTLGVYLVPNAATPKGPTPLCAPCLTPQPLTPSQ